jgi:hypothetical protein
MTTLVEPAIAAVGLRKSFGDHVVLDGLDLSVPKRTACSPARRTLRLMADLHHLDRREGRRRAAEVVP